MHGGAAADDTGTGFTAQAILYLQAPATAQRSLTHDQLLRVAAPSPILWAICSLKP